MIYHGNPGLQAGITHNSSQETEAPSSLVVKQAVSAQKPTQLQTLVGSSSPRECPSSPHATKARESFEDEMGGTKSAARQLPCACSSNA